MGDGTWSRDLGRTTWRLDSGGVGDLRQEAANWRSGTHFGPFKSEMSAGTADSGTFSGTG